MIFASLIIEREPLQWADLGAALAGWVQDVGRIAAVGLALWLLFYLVGPPRARGKAWSWTGRLFALALVGALLSYAACAVLWFVESPVVPAAPPNSRVAPPPYYPLLDLFLTVGGACALFAALLPILVTIGTGRFHVRRIWALARLSFKEALHRRVIWVFSLMGIVILFAAWFLPYKAEDQVRNYVLVVYIAIAILLWLTGSLLGAFSIPTDVRNQTIHTIVTKPVERYEIVLGRFLGYGTLLTIVLAVLTGVGLVYVERGVTVEAQEESYKARVPLFGEELSFQGTPKNEGESVGREWDYRKYLPGPNPNQPKPYAIWSFRTLPQHLADLTDPVRFEFTFDIFRTYKGEVGKGVYCTLTFVSGHLTVPQIEGAVEKIRQERSALRKNVGGDAAPNLDAIEDQLMAKYGVYQASGVEVTDYHTQYLDVPASLFKKVINDGNKQQQEEAELRERERQDLERARQTLPSAEYRRKARALAEEQAQRAAAKPFMKVLVNIEPSSRQQLLGVARRDLYLLAGQKPFWQNFVKGAIGLWFSVMLLLGLTIACSTYLSGIISWILASVLFVGGFFLDYIRTLAENQAVGGGPWVSFFRLTHRVGLAAPLDESTAVSVARGGDQFFGWFLRLVMKGIPDVTRFDLTNYVQNGFDIPWTGVLFLDNLLPLLAYLIPCAIFAYYLMEWREIANPS
jgi:hypothetical protein